MEFVVDLPYLDVSRTRPYLSDDADQPFRAPMEVTNRAVSVAYPPRAYGLNVFWRRPGSEPLWLTADHQGAYYHSGEGGTRSLAGELIGSYGTRVHHALQGYRAQGYRPGDRTASLLAESENRSAAWRAEQSPAGAEAALTALLAAGDALELDVARARPDHAAQRVGCDARHMYAINPNAFRRFFYALFTFATTTFYLISDRLEDFEPTEGAYRFALRDLWISQLEEAGLTVAGRPLLWFHSWVTPDWLAAKSAPELRRYVRAHLRNLVGRYRGRVDHWEVVNELHDWANRLDLTHDEIVALVRDAAQLTREINPGAVRIINNTDAFGTYARLGQREDGVTVADQWTPYTFLRDLIAQDVPFEVSGVQLYRPYRSLTDIVRMIARYEALGKVVFLTELGVPGADDGIYAWDAAAQADWVERIYTVLLSRPRVGAVLWYDYSDSGAFLPCGGLVDLNGQPKEAYHRLQRLLTERRRLPDPPR